MTDSDQSGWEKALTHSERLFVREYLITLNTYNASLAAGIYRTPAIAKANSYKITRRPHILKAIAAAMEERCEALKINDRMVLSEAFRSYLLAMEDKKYNAAARFLEMCGRHVDVQAFRDKARTAMGDDDDGSPDLSRLTDEELAQLERLTKKLAGLDAT